MILDKNLEIIRHITVPFRLFTYGVRIISGFDLLWTYQADQTLIGITLEPNKLFKIENFSINCNSLTLDKGSLTGDLSKIDYVFSPIAQFIGFINEDAEQILTNYGIAKGSANYEYNSIVSNLDLNINNIEIAPLLGDGIGVTQNNLRLYLNQSNSPTNGYFPLSTFNLLAQKTLGIYNTSNVSSKGVVTPNQFDSNFYFSNKNYKKMIISFTPTQVSQIDSSTNTFSSNTTGFISFDLLQYPSGN